MANFSIFSVHVNWPGGYEGSTWPKHDSAGFTLAEESMVKYGNANFSKGSYYLYLPVPI